MTIFTNKGTLLIKLDLPESINTDSLIREMSQEIFIREIATLPDERDKTARIGPSTRVKKVFSI
jgi:hypothetical protein